MQLHSMPPLEIACNRQDAVDVPAIRRILVIVDPTADSQVVVDKAAKIAAVLGSELELYVCDVERAPPATAVEPAAGEEFSPSRTRDILEDLEHYAEPLRTRGLSVTTRCEWHAPLEQGIGHHVLRSRPDLVIKETHRHAAAARIALTDWTLIGQLPAPLLLVRPTPWPAHPSIAVAVDPCHIAERPRSLDHALISLGCLIANGLAGRLEAWHVLESPPHLPGEPATPMEVARQNGAARDQVAAVIGVANNLATSIKAHFLDGPVAQALGGFAAERKPDLLVLGAAARPRYIHSAASGTAAQLLEQLDCDLLVVKPAGFVSPLLVREEEA